MRFISLKTDNHNYSYIEEVFKNMLGSYINCEELDDCLFIYHKEFNIEELKFPNNVLKTSSIYE